MNVRKQWIIAGSLSLVIASLGIAQMRNAKLSVPTDPSQSPSHASAKSNAPQKLPNNPDGLEFERTIVADTPFSATLITESNQRMPDGSVSTKTTTSMIYRDEKGRTRRDWLEEPASSNEVGSSTVKRSVINDPSTGFTYALDHRANVAQQKSFVGVPPPGADARQNLAKQGSMKDQILPMASSSGTDNSLRSGRATASVGQTPESLGAREIEGVLAEGKRFSFTLPAKADNEKPVEIVTERWYAPSILATILIKRTDSRAGDTTYRLTNIKRGEPAADLFIIPRNYKITDESGREVPNARNTSKN